MSLMVQPWESLIDGCPAGLPYWREELMADLSRRKGGILPGTTPRKETDEPEVISGINNNFTTRDTPLVICTRNTNIRPGDYEQFSGIPRPGHADFTAGYKYKGFSDMRGGGHFSGQAYLGISSCRLFCQEDICHRLSFPQISLKQGGQRYCIGNCKGYRDK
ncbi:MAG: chorismate synthase [Marinilabiliales bacterium]|nr:chorismate synthase [Marinilabiliales bacterium]